METAVRRLDGVESVSISMQARQLEVRYAPSARFQPEGIRDAVAQVAVSVDQLIIVARGRLVIDGDQGYFVTGEDRFLLEDFPSMPQGKTISITGIVDDSESPYRLRVMQTRPSR